MKNKSRRIFLRNTSLAATGVCLITPLAASKKLIRNGTAISCAPGSNSLTGSLSSLQSGNWSDPLTWGGKLPDASDTPLISAGHVIIYDMADSTLSGVNISRGSTLKFDETKNTILRTSENIIVEGTLVMQPASHAVFQTLEFIDIKEDQYVGGAAMEVLASDVGLWVTGSGKLDLQGSSKIAWLNAAADLKRGDLVLQTGAVPEGWQVGDEIGITPTILYDQTFERRKIVSLNGNNITIDQPLELDKLKIDGTWTAEIMNLNRNVAIQGTQKGAAHIIIMSSVAQSIRQVEFKNLGPRKDINGDNIKEFIRGRYALHFHHCADGSRGSIVDSCCSHDVYSHSYVFHSSHGITFKKCVAFDVTEIPYWADPGHPMHDTLLDECVAAKVNVVIDSLNMNQETEPDETKSPNAHSSGFKLGLGDGNACINCVAVGTYGDDEGSGGFDWESNNDGAWRFQNCLAHNNQTGLFVWQATKLMHVIENYKAYSNFGHAIYHGSYANVYRYFNGKIFESSLVAKANSIDKRRLRFENIEINANGKFPYAVIANGAQVSSGIPVLIRNVTMKGWTKGPLLLDNSFREDDLSNGAPLLKFLDIVHCDMSGADPFISADTHAGEIIRIQPKPGEGDCYTLIPGSNGIAIKEIIPRFAPDIWGTGTGLLAEYFQGNDFSNLAFQRIDPYLDFSDWYDSGTDTMYVDYRLGQNRSFSVRWTGFLEAQFSEEYELSIDASGSFILILDGVKYTNAEKIKVSLNAGQKYAIEILWSNSDIHMKAFGSGGFSLIWNCKSLENFIKGGEPVPMSQLYPEDAVTPPTPQPPVNQGPIANAGPDIIITLPIASVLLNGIAMDSDGTIKSYSWTKISGPASFSFSNANVNSPTVSNLEPGTYVFRLTVTDNSNVAASDDVQVTVNVADNSGTKTVPTANAGADQIITLPDNIAILSGTGTDPGGKELSYKWMKISGSSADLINDTQASATAINLVSGTYVFRLTVTDIKNVAASDDVQITVNAANPEPKTVPAARAGADQVITLPTNQVVLTGTGTDPKGNKISYKWSQVSGSTATLINSTQPSATAMNLKAGSYVFRLTVTDTNGSSAYDEVGVTVQDVTKPVRSAEVKKVPKITILEVKAYPNPTASSCNLSISSTSDEKITINVYTRWGKLTEAFSHVGNSSTLNIGRNYKRGIYFVHLRQGIKTKIVRLIKIT